jgi:L-asparaginase II
VVESVHYGSVAVVDSNGKLLYATGNPDFVTFFRSASKPFQVLTLVEEGGVERYGFTPEEIALMAGSHSGQAEHIAIIDRILQKVGISEMDLQCGVHPPFSYAAREGTSDPPPKFDQRHHNCSGKHSGMIALALLLGENKADYLNPKGKTQKRILQSVAEACRYPASKIKLGIDGCSAVNFAVPLKNMALGFARLASADKIEGGLGTAMQTVAKAMQKHPLMVAGEKRLDYVLAQTFGDRVIAKAGAEAVECFGLADRGWGAAIKIDDGSSRAMAPVIFSVLKQLGYKFDARQLEGYITVPIKNYRQIVVGRIEAVLRLEKV